MKNLTTQIIILILLFMFPTVSFSQTFKCEFIQEKFKGGKSNKGECSGDPEIVFSFKGYVHPRNEHCNVEDSLIYVDFKDYVVNLNYKAMIYKERTGLVGEDKKEEWRYKEPHILSIHPITQMIGKNIHNTKGDKSTSYLITYKTLLPKEVSENQRIYTLYIPHHGRSIISEYIIPSEFDTDESSWVSMKFGKCVKTSD
jgi:hypothetical protein